MGTKSIRRFFIVLGITLSPLIRNINAQEVSSPSPSKKSPTSKSSQKREVVVNYTITEEQIQKIRTTIAKIKEQQQLIIPSPPILLKIKRQKFTD